MANLRVKVYTTNTCGQCKTVKKFLDIKQIPYETIDLTHDYEGSVQLQQKSGYIGVPVVEVNDTFIKGFNPMALMSAIK